MSTWGRRLVAGAALLVLVLLGVYGARWQPAIDEALRLPRRPDVDVRLYFADGDAQCLLVETRTLSGPPDAAANRWSAEVARVALEALAEGPRTENLWPTIPPGARVRDVVLADGIATVDYSRELRDRHGGGSAGELLTVGSIAGVLSEFPGVEAVQIFVEGEPVDTLAGHFYLAEPIRVAPEALARGRICWDGLQ